MTKIGVKAVIPLILAFQNFQKFLMASLDAICDSPESKILAMLSLVKNLPKIYLMQFHSIYTREFIQTNFVFNVYIILQIS